jgi:hypothetical protein
MFASADGYERFSERQIATLGSPERIRVYSMGSREQSFLIRFPDEASHTLYLPLVDGGMRRCRWTNSPRKRIPSR